MKMKQAFKDIERPEDIDQGELNTYLGELYGEDKFDINDPSYNIENREFIAAWDRFAYKQQVDKIITEVLRLSELADFEHLRKHYVKPLSPGALRIAADEEKTFIELVCFKLAKRREKVNFVKFKNEVEAATLSKCIGGAARNMQMIFFSMEQAEYYQKYNFISHVALEYVRSKKLVNAGNEPHAVNKIIHEVSATYKIVPPRDTHATYRNLEEPVPENMARYAEFYPYLDTLMDTREGVYSYVRFLANDLMSKFPTIEDLNLEEESFSIGEDTSSKSILKINDLLKKSGIEAMQILGEDSAGNYTYKNSYQELIEVIIIKRLIANQMIDFIPIRYMDKEVVEAPSSWYIVAKKEGNLSYRKILDTKLFQGITKDGKNIEDYIHERYQNVELTDQSNFSAQLARTLFFRSDQGTKLIRCVKQDDIKFLPNDEFKRWIEFSKHLMHSFPRALEYIAQHGNISMYGRIFNRFPPERVINFLKAFMQSTIVFGNNSFFQALVERDGVNLNQPNESGNTLLHVAVNRGNIDAVVTLIKAGANQEIKNKEGYPPIHEALRKGRINMVLHMLENNANVRVSYIKKDGHSIKEMYAVEAAVCGNHLDIVRLMFKKDPGLANFINNGIKNIFEQRSTDGNRIICDTMYECLLDNGVSPYSLNSSGLSEFMIHCAEYTNGLQSKNKLEFLLDKGFDPKRGNDNLNHNQGSSTIIYHSALDYCKKNGNMHSINLMLKKGAINKSDLEFDGFDQKKIDARFNAGRTYLQFAVQKGFGIEALINAGANLNCTNNYSGTAMHYAITHENPLALQQLLDAGADYSLCNKAGNPVLHHAIKSISIESVSILLESVDPNIKNVAGQNALEYFDCLKDRQKKSKLGKEIKKLLDNKILEKNSQMIEDDISTIKSFEQSSAAGAAFDVSGASAQSSAAGADFNISGASAQEMKMGVEPDMRRASSSGASWQERVNKRAASAEEKGDHSSKRARGSSFVERVEKNPGEKERW